MPFRCSCPTFESADNSIAHDVPKLRITGLPGYDEMLLARRYLEVSDGATWEENNEWSSLKYCTTISFKQIMRKFRKHVAVMFVLNSTAGLINTMVAWGSRWCSPGTVMQRICEGSGTGSQPVKGTNWKAFELFDDTILTLIFDHSRMKCLNDLHNINY